MYIHFIHSKLNLKSLLAVYISRSVFAIFRLALNLLLLTFNVSLLAVVSRMILVLRNSIIVLLIVLRYLFRSALYSVAWCIITLQFLLC